MSDKLHWGSVQEYLGTLVPPRGGELGTMEADAAASHFPIIGPVAGHLCYQLARMVGARRVFELGSGFGYSTAWFARAVVENGGGEVFHVVWDKELSRRARGHLAELGFDEVVRYHVGEAVATLRDTGGLFDVIFNDIDKQDYPKSIEVAVPLLRPGGLFITDNTLWKGRVAEPGPADKLTDAVRAFNKTVFSRPDLDSVILAVRDGITVCRRK